MLMPAAPTNPEGFIYFVVITGALFGIIIGKLVFGGTGQNIFNPAAVGFIFTKVCFASKFSSTYYSSTIIPDATAGGTLLTGSASPSVLELLLGETGGTFGEVCKIAILCGLVFLLVRHAADWRVVSSFFGTFLVLTAIAGLVYTLKGSVSDYGTWFLSHGLLVYFMGISHPGRFRGRLRRSPRLG